MKPYLELLQDILDNGVKRDDRTSTGTLSVFGRQLRFELSEGFPLLTTKKLHVPSIGHELLWFLKGSTNIKYLVENKVHIWDNWADEQGDLGPIYGYQWRSWPTGGGQSIDQISQVIGQIKNNPHSRRHIVSAWNVGDLEKMALPPCHLLFQFYVAEGKLSCQLYQRSADCGLGLPFNIASYSLLTLMMAQVCELKVGEFIISLGDAHIYLNHLEPIRFQLQRTPYPLPTMKLNQKVNDLFNFQYEDFILENYQAHPHIKMAVSV